MHATRLEQVVRQVRPLPEIDRGLLDGTGDVRVGREVISVVDALEVLRQLLEVAQISHDELETLVAANLRQVLLAPRAQIVEDLDARVRLGKEPWDEVTA